MRAQGDPATSAWRAMRRLVLELHDRRGAVSEATGMSYLRVKALSRLTPGPLSQRQRSDTLMTDAPYTSLLVDDLEQRGMVRREANPADRRSKLVRITPAGRAVARKAERIQSAPPAALAALSEADLAALDRTLRIMLDGSDQRG
jgi:DNA-binding MarR family transcriptional regulator